MSARMHMRKFDHDEARRRYKAGESLRQIATAFCVSPSAIYLAVDRRTRLRSVLLVAERQQSGKCIDCGEPCSYNPYMPGRAGRCRKCAGAARAHPVRDTELWCWKCETWQHDLAFSYDGSRRASHRRGRRKVCTACDTALRTAYRERRKIPCAQCGEPRLPASEKRRDGCVDSGLCLACYRASRTKAVSA